MKYISLLISFDKSLLLQPMKIQLWVSLPKATIKQPLFQPFWYHCNPSDLGLAEIRFLLHICYSENLWSLHQHSNIHHHGHTRVISYGFNCFVYKVTLVLFKPTWCQHNLSKLNQKVKWTKYYVNSHSVTYSSTERPLDHCWLQKYLVIGLLLALLLTFLGPTAL